MPGCWRHRAKCGSPKTVRGLDPARSVLVPLLCVEASGGFRGLWCWGRQDSRGLHEEKTALAQLPVYHQGTSLMRFTASSLVPKRLQGDPLC